MINTYPLHKHRSTNYPWAAAASPRLQLLQLLLLQLLLLQLYALLHVLVVGLAHRRGQSSLLGGGQ